MEEKPQNDNQEEEKTERNEQSEKDFFTKMFETFGQDDDKKNIYIQYRIINNHGIMASDSAHIEQIHVNGKEKAKKESKGEKKKAKQNIFSDENKRNKWLSENDESYPMALMIAVAVFDGMPYMWVMRAADTLYEDFENKHDKEEKRCGITETLSQFGAVICKGELNTYTGKTPIDIVQLDQKISQETILKYIWIEYPKLHKVIMIWLEKYYNENIISMSKRAGEIMGQLACWDYHYFLNCMVTQIKDRNSIRTDMMIAQTVKVLDEKNEFHGNITKLLVNWSKDRNVHYLLTGLFVCVGQKDENRVAVLKDIISCYIDRIMKELHIRKQGEYLRWEWDFFAAGMRAFTFYRFLIKKGVSQ